MVQIATIALQSVLVGLPRCPPTRRDGVYMSLCAHRLLPPSCPAANADVEAVVQAAGGVDSIPLNLVAIDILRSRVFRSDAWSQKAARITVVTSRALQSGGYYMLDITMDWSDARFTGKKLKTSRRTVADLENYFLDQSAVKVTPPGTLLYEVQSYEPLPGGTDGGLFWGNTTLYPGTIGDEYFMTKGHFHHVRNRGEFYVTRKGQGELLLMEEGGPTVAETMSPGSVHYIPGHHAHRVANTGNEPLIFIACWPSDAGYDYAAIERNGFSARLLKRNGVPTLVPQR